MTMGETSPIRQMQTLAVNTHVNIKAHLTNHTVVEQQTNKLNHLQTCSVVVVVQQRQHQRQVVLERNHMNVDK